MVFGNEHNETPKSEFQLNSIEEALEDIRLGKVVIVVDDEDRENEGDFICAADKVTPAIINFMAKYGRGLICTPITPELADDLDLKLMQQNNTELHQTAFTISIDLMGYGCSTGISAYDRATGIKKMTEIGTKASDYARPGHIFPLIAKKGGVLRRAGHTEAAVDLARLAGLYPAGVVVEILNDDGTMARLPDLVEIAKEHNIKLITIADLIKYRLNKETLVEQEAVVQMPTEHGDFELIAFKDKTTDNTLLALKKGEWEEDEPILVRVHSSCMTGDIFGSMRCDCGPQLDAAMKKVEEAGKGVILYINQEGRGIGLINKLKAYKLQEEGYDTVEANIKLGFKPDQRDYGVGAQVLRQLGISKIKLMTNNPRKRVGLIGYGLEIMENIPLEIEANQHNASYLRTKRDKLGHAIFQKGIK
ncbi:MAG: bifunctional 3,4-dihydroxy-2-butanone-4-phosphate synthase/GTP cyclohydrolase II [Aureispira sp.]|nr:bifunctional 3,4-dihydroxy-2-butanone-4-phosphate synthase/GTP cyclohydrolase II [Aureispira sp.]